MIAAKVAILLLFRDLQSCGVAHALLRAAFTLMVNAFSMTSILPLVVHAVEKWD
jgi:hypothetical protein